MKRKNTDALRAITNALGGAPNDGGNLKELKAILAALNDGELDSEAANAKLSSDVLYRIAGAIEDGGGGGGGSEDGKTLTLTVSGVPFGGVLVKSSHNMEGTQVSVGQTVEIPVANDGEFVVVSTMNENHKVSYYPEDEEDVSYWNIDSSTLMFACTSNVNIKVNVENGLL